MKHAIIFGHPDPSSFTGLLVKTYEEMAATMGHSAVVRDLYRLDFDPRLQVTEMPTREGFEPAADVLREREVIGDADVFAFVYPLWFNAPPAIVKGYIDRVFSAGFGYRAVRSGGQDPLLSGRQLIHITCSGSSIAWLNEQGAWMSLHNLFVRYFGRVCGMTVRPSIHFDSILDGLEARWVQTNLQTLRTRMQEYFAPDAEDALAPSRRVN